ncbi:hypothetical protein ACFL1H_05030 [Nanoarchaeota archaeon]
MEWPLIMEGRIVERDLKDYKRFYVYQNEEDCYNKNCNKCPFVDVVIKSKYKPEPKKIYFGIGFNEALQPNYIEGIIKEGTKDCKYISSSDEDAANAISLLKTNRKNLWTKIIIHLGKSRKVFR